MDTRQHDMAKRLSDALARFPTVLPSLNDFAEDADFPRTPRGQAAFCRQLLAGLASHVADPHIRRLVARLGAHAETSEDVDQIAKLGAMQVQVGEHALVGLMLEALSPTPRWNGIDGLRAGVRTEGGAFAIVLVVAALPRTAGAR
jgi:hypothetical protein